MNLYQPSSWKGHALSKLKLSKSKTKLARTLLINSIEQTLEVIKQLTSVKTVYIEQKFGFDGLQPAHIWTVPLLHKFFVDAWCILKHRVTKLVLTSPIDDLNLVFPQTHGEQIQLPNLSEFMIHLSIANPFTNVDSYVLPFLHSHRHTLREITLHVPLGTNRLEPVILKKVADISTINSLDVDLEFVGAGTGAFDGLHRVLEAHSESLTCLSLRFGRNSNLSTLLFSQKWSRVRLPRLTSLTLSPPQWDITSHTHDYILQFAPTLTSLSLLDARHRKYHDRREFTLLLGKFKYLKHLDAYLTLIDLGGLVNIASNLQHLHSLHIRFIRVRPATAIFDDMKQYKDVFSKWELRSISLTPKNCWWTESVLFFGLPNVQLFCGLERGDYAATNPLISQGIIQKRWNII